MITSVSNPDPVSRIASSSVSSRLVALASAHRGILILLSALFLGRFFLSDWNSYWNDEILSVYVYGMRNETWVESIRSLANGSIHPPLYQGILYVWMDILGHAETSTRTLSNVFVTLASLFLYATLQLSWSRKVSFWSTAAFSVAGTATYYALETRSYGLTLFLASLSSFLLLKLLLRMRHLEAWTLSRNVLLFSGVAMANTGLMLTHYYNVFWLLGQVVFIIVFLLLEFPRRELLRALALFAALSVTPIVAFALIWGPVFARQFFGEAGSFAVDGGVQSNPIELLLASVVSPNVAWGAPMSAIALVVVTLVTALALAALVRHRNSQRPDQTWSLLYLACWLFLPLVMAFLAFTIAGVERYNARYFIYSVAPFFALMVLALVIIRDTLARQNRLFGSPAISSALAVVLLSAFFIPTGYDAAITRKADWRGIVQQVIDHVERDEGTDYFILDTSFSRASRSDYYFARLSDTIRSDEVIPRRWERQDDLSDAASVLPPASPGTKVVLVLNHHTDLNYPRVIAMLAEEYGGRHDHLDASGRGFIIFGGSG